MTKIFSLSLKKYTPHKKTLQVNKSKNFLKFLETLKTNAQATMKFIIAEAAAFVFAVAEVCIENLATLLAVTICTRIFFGKANKSNVWHKKSFQVSVLGKSFSKTSNKNPEIFSGHQFFEW